MRAMTRHPTSPKAQALSVCGATTFAADLNSLNFLRDALKSSHTVFAVTNYWEEMSKRVEIQQGENVADVTKVVDVKHCHVVCPAGVLQQNFKTWITKDEHGDLVVVEPFDFEKMRLPLADPSVDVQLYGAGFLCQKPEDVNGAHFNVVSRLMTPREALAMFKRVAGWMCSSGDHAGVAGEFAADQGLGVSWEGGEGGAGGESLGFRWEWEDLGGSVRLANGTSSTADVIVGADGLRSYIRIAVLGHEVDLVDTGDMAFRITIPGARVAELNSSVCSQLLEDRASRIWLGPLSQDVICYLVRNSEIFNFVLLRPHDLPSNMPTAEADVSDMKAAIRGWDPSILQLLDCVERCLKWKICHMDELATWTSGHVALLGDACRSTLPYLAQGAAMVGEHGAMLSILLGGLSRSGKRERVPQTLDLYEEFTQQEDNNDHQRSSGHGILLPDVRPRRNQKRNQDLANALLHDPTAQSDGSGQISDTRRTSWASTPSPSSNSNSQNGQDSTTSRKTARGYR